MILLIYICFSLIALHSISGDQWNKSGGNHTRKVLPRCCCKMFWDSSSASYTRIIPTSDNHARTQQVTIYLEKVGIESDLFAEPSFLLLA